MSLSVEEMKQALNLQNRGQLADAKRLYAAILESHPEQSIALAANYNLALLSRALGNTEEAIICYRRALAIKPQFPEALTNLGEALDAAGIPDEAIECFHKALEINPEMPKTLYNLANAMGRKGNLQEAVALYQRALASDPAYLRALNALGVTLQMQGKLDAAIDVYRQAIMQNPQFADAYHNLGIALSHRGKLAEAMVSTRKALDLGLTEALGTLVSQKNAMCDWSDVIELEQVLLKQPGSCSPFVLLSISASPVEHRIFASSWAKRWENAGRRGHWCVPASDGKIHIGYLSADFREHPVSYLMAELFERHDRSQFEISAYSFGVNDGGKMRRRLVRTFDRFVDIREMSHHEAASLIIEDRIEILVDLSGYTKDARVEIPALRPAPVQVNYLGYPGTMGAHFMDYIVADHFVIPKGAEQGYSEKVVRLPNAYQPNDPTRPIADTLSRTAYGLPEAAFVLCCFNQLRKVRPEMFRAWAEIMRILPGSILWLLEDYPAAAANLRREAQMQGIAPHRLVFAPRLSLADHLARYRVADLAVDTFPYTSHTTASDALWVGCPLATLAGNTFASRVAGSLLSIAGLKDLIAGTLEEYVQLVQHLAGDPTRLKGLRTHLCSIRDTSVLFDTTAFGRHLELAYQEMSATWRAGELPRHIEIS
jgi:predicted O-linked N-acetylglucosamine transferase (SPINDLY family)